MRGDPPDFETLIKSLVEAEVRFVIIGGLAMRLQGSAYITDDIDVGYARDTQNLEAVVRALAPLNPRLRGAPPDLPFRLDARTFRMGQNFTFETDAGDIDLLGDIAGAPPFDELWQRSQAKELFGYTVQVARVEDIISMKRAAGRRKDQDHLRELEALLKLTAGEQDLE